MRYAIAHKSDPQALLRRLLYGPQAGVHEFAQPSVEHSEPITYLTWAGAIKIADMLGGKVVSAP